MSNHRTPIDDFDEWGAYCTDLAVERRRLNTDISGARYSCHDASIGSWEEIRISSPCAAKSIGKPEGSYYTLSLPKIDILDEGEIEDAIDEIARTLCRICDDDGIIPDILCIGARS